MQSLLIIGYVWPEPTATAAGSRMLQIIEQFQLLSYNVTFVCPAQKPITAFDLNSINVRFQKIVLNDSSFDEFLEKLTPSVVLFDRFMIEEQFGWRVVEKCPGALRILDSEDLHFLRKARQLAIKKEENLPQGLIHSDEAKREIASIYRCDATLTISEYEMNYLSEVYQIPEKLLWYFPFLVDVDKLPKPLFDERQDFLFIGNFIHPPNWDAVLQLKQHIWPKIKKKIPKAKLHVYGGYPSNKVFQLHNEKERFLVHGRAEDVNEVMKQVKVCLAPLRFGAGLKGKLIDAMQNNTPFITSEIGAEGMFGSEEMSSFISTTKDDFVSKSIDLYNDKELWNSAVKKGKDILKTRFEKTNFKTVFKQKLNDSLVNKKDNRAQNFIGSMLQHHSLKSTMYLSKWIEEKNKI